MRSIILGSLLALTVSGSAFAQDYGLTAGLSGSSASSSVDGISAGSAQFGFRAGGVAAFPLTEDLKFRTGLIFSQRHFEMKIDNTSTKGTGNFDYLDIPVLAQYNFNETWGIFGGLIAAINVNKSFSQSGGGANVGDATGVKGLIPLVQVGVSATFDNMYGVEAYYEIGLGSFYDGGKNLNVAGVNFIYWL